MYVLTGLMLAVQVVMVKEESSCRRKDEVRSDILKLVAYPRTPEAWVIGRAFLFGLPPALLPITAYLRLSRTNAPNSPPP
jgi:hypothetical protein